MEKETSYIVGFDLGIKYAQISYAGPNGEEGEVKDIPACLCKRNEANQWFYGREAQKFYAGGKGELFENLTELVMSGEKVDVEEQETEPEELLALFIRKCLDALDFYKEGAKIRALVIAVNDLSPRMIEALEKVKAKTLTDIEDVYFEAKAESLFYYTIHQPKELWSYEVGVLDFSDGFLKLYRIVMNHKSKPVLTTIEEEVFEDMVIPDAFPGIMEKDLYLEHMDERLCGIMEKFLEGRIVTGIYLTGKVFEKEWYPKTLKLLCRNRRVFGGNNLYSKGACYGGREKVFPEERNGNYLYLGREKLKSNIGVIKMEQGRQLTEILLEGGVNWFDAEAEFVFMPGEDYHLPVVIVPPDGGKERIVPVVLPEFPGRDIKSLRFKCRLSMASEKELLVEIEDAGFGEFYQSTGRRFEETVFLGGGL